MNLHKLLRITMLGAVLTLLAGTALAQAGRYYQLAIQIKPDWPDPYLRVAYAYLNKGDMAKAAENLEKFIKLEPASERTSQAKNILATIRK